MGAYSDLLAMCRLRPFVILAHKLIMLAIRVMQLSVLLLKDSLLCRVIFKSEDSLASILLK